MSVRRGRLIAAGALTAVIAGCVPIPIPHRTLKLTVRGQVLDDARVPLRDCDVKLVVPREPDAIATRTSDDGSFLLTSAGEQRYVFWFPLLPYHTMDHIPGTVTITCLGFTPFEKDVVGRSYHVAPAGNGNVDLETVILERVPAQGRESP